MPRFSTLKSIGCAWSGTQRRFAASRPTPCAYSDVDVTVPWSENIEPLVTPRYHQGRLMLSNIMSSTAGMQKHSDLHFGEFADVAFGANAITPLVAEASFKAKPTSKMVDFQTRKREGEIVLNPLEQFTAVATCNAGALKSNCTHYGTRFVGHYTPEIFATFPLQLTCPTYGEGRNYGDYLLQRTNAAGDKHTNFTYDIWTTANLTHPMGVDGLNGLIYHVVEYLRALTPDSSLATAVKAEANAKTLDILTAFAELPDTMHSIMGAVREILTRFVNVKRKIKSILRNAAGLATESANLWLMWRYEIMPFILTIEDGLKVLNASMVEYQTTRVGLHNLITIPAYAGWSTPEIDVLDRGYLKRRFDATMGVAEQQLSANVLVTWWELQPLSFVVDWVLNIGDLLGSLGSPRGTMQDASSYSWRYNDTCEFTNPDWVGPPIVLQLNYYKLSVLDLNQHLGLTINPSMTWKRWLDAFSLSWLAYKGSYLNNVRKL